MAFDFGSLVSNVLGKAAKNAQSQLQHKAATTVSKAAQNLGNSVEKGINNALLKKENVVFDTLPHNLDELMACDGSDLTNPFKTAAFMIAALNAYVEDPAAGLEMFNYLNGPEEFSNMQKQTLDFAVGDAPYIPRSYFNGAKPDNDYTPTMPYTVHVQENAHSKDEAGYMRLYVTSGGADSPRHILLRAKGDKWYIYQSQQQLMSGIRLPKSEDKWA